MRKKRGEIWNLKNGTGSPLSDHFFLSAYSEINSHFNQNEESTETSIVSSLPFYSVSNFTIAFILPAKLH